MTAKRWFSETLTPGVRLSLEARRVLRRERTESQDLALFDNDVFGRVLMLDGAVQLTSGDEFIYHEMMAHVPLLAHGSARDVLIVGGGDCGLAEEVLKHSSVRRLVQVEIDPTVVELAREHFSELNGAAFSDPRFDLRIGDGAAFARESSERFDVVLVDSTDPVGPGMILFTREFYADLHARLNPGGIMVSQNGVPFLQAREFADAMRNLAAVFRHVSCYLIAVPTYFGGHLALGWVSDDVAPLSIETQTLAARFESAGLETRYYTPGHHKAAFCVPRYIEDALAAAVEEGRRGRPPES